MYLKFYLCLHIVALITIFVLPKFIRGERRSHPPQTTSSKTSLASEEQKPLINNITANNSQHKDQLLKDSKELENKTTIEPLTATTTVTKQSNTSSSPTSTNKDASTIPSVSDERPAADLPAPKLPLVNPGRDAVSVPHDQCEMDQLSSKLMEKIEAETKNIEEFIDKTVTETVTGIVEFKNDLMREIPNGLRKRTSLATSVNDVVAGAAGKPTTDESAAFLKKEIEVINAVVQQANVLPAVLSNGHAK